MQPRSHSRRPRVVPLAAALLLTSSTVLAQTTALVGATVIDGTGTSGIPNAVLLVTRDRLACVGTVALCPIPADAKRVDVTGRFVTPGLVDANVHLSETGWVDGRPDLIDAPALYPYAETARALRANPARWFRAYLCSGVTAVYDVGGHPWTTTLAARTEHDSLAPHVRAVGPVLTHAPRAALRVDDEIYSFLPMTTPADVRASVAALKAMGASAVTVRYSAPAATRNGAQAMGRVKDFGTLEAGKLADLLILAEDPRRDV